MYNVLREDVTKNEKLRNDLTVITICLANYTSKACREPTNILMFQCSSAQFTRRLTSDVFLPATEICRKSIVVHHSSYLNSWHRYTAKQHTECIVEFPLQQCYVMWTVPIVFFVGKRVINRRQRKESWFHCR
jgi:hypothetical protein